MIKHFNCKISLQLGDGNLIDLESSSTLDHILC